MSRFSVENFLSHSAENCRRRILYCCNNFGYRKSLEKRGGGVTRFSFENFLSHSAESFPRGILCCCILFGYRKSLGKRGGGYQDFPSKVFCLTVPKISVGESFTVALISGSEKSFWTRGGRGVSRFSINFFLCHSAENLRRESFTVALISATEKVWMRVSRYSVENILSHSPEKVRR